MTHNPFAPPTSLLISPGESHIPLAMLKRTSRIVNWFGLFEILAWLIVAYWTDRLFLDLFALFIATNGARIRRDSCRTFPWTIVMCAVYPLIFIASLMHMDATNIDNWLPLRGSPVLGLQLIVAVWALIASGALLQCFLHQRSR